MSTSPPAATDDPSRSEMATFSPMECYGAVGRDVIFRHGSNICGRRSPSEISFSSVDVDEDKLTRPLPCSPPRLSLSPPPSSTTHIVPEDMFLKEAGHDRFTPGHVESIHPAAPLDRFAGTLQTYESIAMALAMHTRIQQPYQDYVPCPCSGPGSPAMSVASDKFIRPGAAPPLTEPPLPQLSVGKFPLGAFADPRIQLDAGHTPMSRFLADDGPYEWMAPTFDCTTRLSTVEIKGQQHSAETSQKLSEYLTRKDADTAAVDNAEQTSGSPHATLQFIEFAAGEKNSQPEVAEMTEVMSTFVKKLDNNRQQRVMRQNLPRINRNPRKRESPPQKKRRIDDGEP